MEQVIRYPGEVDSEILAQLQIIRDWANRTKTGDLGEIAELAEDSPALPRVTSTIDNCLGRECPQYEDCYLVKSAQRSTGSGHCCR